MDKELRIEIFLHEEALLGALRMNGETIEQTATRLLRNELQHIAAFCVRHDSEATIERKNM